MLITLKWLNLLIVLMYLKGYSLSNSCDKQTRCQDCIRDSAGCVWCASNDSTIEKRCKLRNTFDNTWCPGELQNPEGLVSSDDKHNQDFRSDPGNIIQIKPQKYSLKARVGEPINFNFFFKGAKDYPVDLYFLFDASRTMIRVKTEIADKSQKIYETMKNITNDVYLGMGTFVDKNSIPFTGHIDSNMVYSFKHSLKLTTDLNKFKDSVSNILFGQNRDSPEGGLDALAQVIVCKDTIGWRNESRKIVVFVTDSPYHAAGDGQPAGITQPYDGKCYTNTVYTKELEMDYPSVSIINKLAAQHDVIILFLIEDKYESLYQDLSRAISGSKVKSYHPNANTDGSIVDILRDIYQKISKVIKLKTIVKVGNRKNVMVTFDPDCTQINNDKNCGTKSEEEKKFTGTLKILEYDGTDNYTVEIAIEGISEKLTLDIEVISDCQCTKEAKKSEYCHEELRECGICKCGDHRYGDKCACVRNVQNLHNDNITCIAKGSNEMCSNHGTCICGTCSCHEGYEDQYCQCNKDSCPRDTKNNLCSGHGKCRCGTCSCDNGWQGEDCHCPTSTEGCLGLKGVICNNKGTCKCGECKCRDIPEWYKRYDGQDELCNLTPNPQYHMLQCRYLNDCVLSFWNQQACEEDNMVVNWAEEFIEVHTNSTEWNPCPDIKVDVGCYSSYVYKYNDDIYGIDILVLKHKDCTKNYLIYGITCLGIIVFIGIATIVGWKLLTDARDRKEYLKFKKDHAADLSELCHNPVYAPANVTFTNPTFRKQSITTN